MAHDDHLGTEAHTGPPPMPPFPSPASPTAGTQTSGSASRGGDSFRILVAGTAILTCLAVVIFVQATGGETPSEGEASAATEDSQDETTTTVSTTTTPSTTEPPQTTPTTQTTTTKPPIVQLRPEGIVGVSNVRDSVSQLRCGGSNSFEAEFLIDGDEQTGWGAASRGDAVGEWIAIDFGRPVVLTEVGLTPGYLRFAPRSATDCQDSLAFDYNRFVTKVEWEFDNSPPVEQTFTYDPRLQTESIGEVETQLVVLYIRGTDSPVKSFSDDNDTIMSEVAFRGYEP